MQPAHTSIPPSSPPPREGDRLRELKLWLRGLVHRPDFFTAKPPHPLRDLQTALALAVSELTGYLEPRLEEIIDTACDAEHNIQLKVGDFDQDRKLDIDDLDESGLAGIRLMGRQAVVKCLVLARDEIEWVENEANRLEVHAQNAEELKRASHRQSFEYRPMSRKVRGPADWAIGDIEEDDDDDEEEEEVVDVNNEQLTVEHSEEEMLDEDENGDVEDERHDGIVAGSWGALKIEPPD